MFVMIYIYENYEYQSMFFWWILLLVDHVVLFKKNHLPHYMILVAYCLAYFLFFFFFCKEWRGQDFGQIFHIMTFKVIPEDQ